MLMKLIRVPLAIVVGFFLLLFIYSLISSNAGASDDADRVEVTQQEREESARLANSVGVDFGKSYRRQEWADLKREIGLFDAGNYEFLDCSNGMLEHGMCDYAKSQQYWESVYDSSENATFLLDVWADGDASYVKILKIKEGRDPQIHQG